ncbi:hypothetical protein GKG47_14075 [Lactonifactor sp. BIOML-A3]|uniref:hypothetical protein n=1 Tax=unclassified Lactonifactor TaxID=2636670 RepID=UPI0012B061C1|nr:MULTISPECIES: hypothetical protein [unclassified Lactonifactor]MSA02910.1 hypothetical protein [Lactonifactor sp. BIOML-A5]MSA10269.1 hypothetical protein [Lactonifactor sp. BIOML-A4]MSA13557.1 hypothetical protein [Lactonifactor sp. BIOML-A3]MSA19242.1 hypothetical protein [Lactonifactor sp. BIOML-A2]MSA39111.1 hypothetical protein [Lactonifactor sp. BIOML-A1]
MANKITFKGELFKTMMEQLDSLNGDLKTVTQKALQKTHEYITPKLQEDMKCHRRTGRTEGSIDQTAKVNWEGNTAGMDVGFHIRSGGLASIFLMYGTPKMAKDQKLYNDVYGSKTKKEIEKMQQEILTQEIQKKMGG